MNPAHIYDRLSIGRKLTLLMMLAATLSLFLGSILFVVNDGLTLQKEMLDRQAALSRVLGLHSVPALDFNDAHSAEETLGALEANSNIIAAAVYDAGGKIFARYEASSARHENDMRADWPEVIHERAEILNFHYIETFEPIRVEGRHLGTIYLRGSTSEWFENLHRQLYVILVVLVLVGLIVWGVAHVLQQRVTRPLLSLASLARQVASTKNFGLRASVARSDEVGTLTNDVNIMLQEIQERDEKLGNYRHNLERLVQERTAALEDMTRQLHHQAHHDDLTGLPNRKRYEALCDLAFIDRQADGGQFAVMFMDLERFKLVNDTLGHHFGDKLLKIVAERLKNCLRDSDIIARQGGDEFTMLLPKISSKETARLTAERILSALAPRFEIDGHILHVTGSIGISVYPEHGQSVEALLRHADIAMYSAKAEGGNSLRFYNHDLHAHGTHKLRLETALRQAIQQKQLEVHYQPIILASSGEITSFEALVRWRHPELGMISPGDFLPVAEDTGLITQIDEWVFRQASQQVAAWHRQGHQNLGITVNLSTRQFERPALPDILLQIVAETGTPPHAIELEITESMLISHTGQVAKTLANLKALGFRLAVDDFGTGYSSLSYLKRFPLDRLKIDRSFVQDLPQDKDNAAITQAIIAMAQSLKLDITVEGVETQAQLDFLNTLGSHSFQGFFFGRPVPSDAASKLLSGGGAANSAGKPFLQLVT